MTVTVINGDCRQVLDRLADNSVQCCVTSPPYFGLRDYQVRGQIGLEKTPDAFVSELLTVFRAVRRVLREDGTLWLNLGDSYSQGGNGGGNKQDSNKGSLTVGPKKTEGYAPKQLLGIPWKVAFALQADGWWLRQDIIWNKPNPMPESVKDRCTKAHEYVFMLSKSPRYYYDADAISEPAIYSGPIGQDQSGYKDAKKFAGKHSDKQRGHSRRHAGFNERWDNMTKAGQCSGRRNKRSVWTIPTLPFAEAHFATFPPELPELCIKAGSKPGDTILDPFGGAGTTGMVADRLGRNATLIDLNPAYAAMAKARIFNDAPLLAEVV